MSAQLNPLPDVLQSIRLTTDTRHEATNQQLNDTLSLLFEPSPTLNEEIAPLLIQRIRSTADEGQLPKSYASLIDIVVELVSEMPDDQKATFIGAHPRIGEVKKLSALSAAEQGQAGQTNTDAVPTPTAVLERLACLNNAYEWRFPGLVYITFVNGRTRAQVRDELEEKLRKEGVIPKADATDGLNTIVPHDVRDDAWRSELGRAIGAIRDIARSRLEKLGAA